MSLKCDFLYFLLYRYRGNRATQSSMPTYIEKRKIKSEIEPDFDQKMLDRRRLALLRLFLYNY
jgi:hypothetical protein